MDLVKISLKVLTERINCRLGTGYDETYLSRVRRGIAGAPALQDVVKSEEARILQEAADAAKAA